MPAAVFEPVEEVSMEFTPVEEVPVKTKQFVPVEEVAPRPPKKTIAQFLAEPEAAVSESSPVTPGELPTVRSGLETPFPTTEQQAIAQQVPEGTPPIEIGAKEAQVPRFGKEGTLTRGVSDVVGGLAEWALNKPEEFAATFTPLAPAVAARYAPEIAMQFAHDVKAGAQGDRQALGRALSMAVLIGVPKSAQVARERYLLRGKSRETLVAPEETALEATLPKPFETIKEKPFVPVEEVTKPTEAVPEVPLQHETVLPTATETFKEITGEAVKPSADQSQIVGSKQNRQVPEWLADRLKEREAQGWNRKWPFVPADLMNKSFRDAILSDPTLSLAEKQQIMKFGPLEAAEEIANYASKIEGSNSPVRDVLRSDEVREASPGELPQGANEGGEGIRGNEVQEPTVARTEETVAPEPLPTESSSGTEVPRQAAQEPTQAAGMVEPAAEPALEAVNRKLVDAEKRGRTDTEAYRKLTEQFVKLSGEQARVETGQTAIPITEQSLTADIRQLQRRIDLRREEQKQIALGRKKLTEKQKREWNAKQSEIDSAAASIKALEIQRNALRKPASTPASAAVKVEAQIKEVARTEGTRPAKEVKSELVDRIEQAMKGAPEASEWSASEHGYVEINIPGDGSFRIARNLKALGEIRDAAKRIKTSPQEATTKVTPDRELAHEIIKKDVKDAVTVYGTEENAYQRLTYQLDRAAELGIEGPQLNRLKRLTEALEKRILEPWELARRKLSAAEDQIEHFENQKIAPSEESKKRVNQLTKEVANELATVEQKLGRKPWEPRKPAEPAPEIVGMGGAVPEEFKPQGGTVTSIKNAVVDQERAKRGLPSAIQPAKRSFGTVWDEAMAKIDRDPSVQDNLILSLRENPRALTDLEDALLLHRQIDLQNEYGKATRDLAQAYDDGRMADVEIQRARVGDLSNRLLDIYEIGKKSGTETGRGLNARKMLADEDFNLAKMEVEMRSAKGGKPLTDAERIDMTKTADEFAKIKADLEAKVAERDKLLAEEHAARVFAEMKAQEAKPQPHIQRIIDRIGTVLDDRANKARERLKGKLFSLSPDVLKDLAEIGASNIYHVGLDFAKWSARMIEDIGERIKPHLEKVWEESQKYLDRTTDEVSGKTDAQTKKKAKESIRTKDTPEEKADKLIAKITERVNKGDTDVSVMVQKLARAFVESGVKDLNALIDRVHEVLSEVMPEDWTRRDTMDEISGYGKIKLLKKDEISVRLRDLKGQMQQIAKLEDMAAGQAPSKTGLERRVPTDIERELIKKVNEAKRKGGYVTTDPETQLKSALDTVKTRMRNEMNELARRLREGDYTKRTKREIELDDAATRLRMQLDEMRRAWHQKVLEKKLADEGIAQKAYRKVIETANTVRAVETGLDLSAVLRQGKFVLLQHPIVAARAIVPMLKAMASKVEAYRIDQEILHRDNYPRYQRAKLYLSEHGVPLSRMEEAYMSRWAEKIPLVAGSQRAYTTFLNKLRADSFDVLTSSLDRRGKGTPENDMILANAINVFTGRGTIGMKENMAVSLNAVFFAPRFVASRFQTIIGQPLWFGTFTGKARINRATLPARALIAGEYAKMLAGYGLIYTLANLAGFEVGTDPNSSDFGKIIVSKNIRIDPLAGVSQATVLLSRVSSGMKTTASGKKQSIYGKVPFGRDTVSDVIWKFLRSKFAPIPGAVLDYYSGTDVTGKPVDLESALLDLSIPITGQDVYKGLEEAGIPGGTALGILSLFGESVQIYDDKRKK